MNLQLFEDFISSHEEANHFIQDILLFRSKFLFIILLIGVNFYLYFIYKYNCGLLASITLAFTILYTFSVIYCFMPSFSTKQISDDTTNSSEFYFTAAQIASSVKTFQHLILYPFYANPKNILEIFLSFVIIIIFKWVGFFWICASITNLVIFTPLLVRILII